MLEEAIFDDAQGNGNSDVSHSGSIRQDEKAGMQNTELPV
jgi:hypothetical protein